VFAIIMVLAAVLTIREARAGDSMSYREMADTMQMDDTVRFGKVLFDQLEWRDGDKGEGRGTWDGQAWYGGDYDKLWVKSEGKYVSTGHDTGLHDALHWGRLVAPFRRDRRFGQSRGWRGQ
jgi:copper resistance protein B